MKKVLIGIGVVIGLLVAAIIALPLLIDPNIFKPQIIAEAKKATGRDVAIDGPLRLSILPTPSVSAEGVRLANAPGGKAPQMVEIKAVRAGVSLLPLLARRIEVHELRLVEPKIALEVGPDGRANYDFTSADPAPPTDSPKTNTTATASDGSKFAVAINQVVIENGTLTWSNAQAGREYRLEKMSLSVSAPSREGPFAAAGSLTANGVPLSLDGKVGARSDAGMPVDVQVKTPGGEARLAGKLSALTADARFAGTASIAATDFASFVQELAAAGGMPALDLPPALARKMSFEGNIDASADGFTARAFKLGLGEDQGSGTLAVTLKPATRIEGKLSFTKLDLDKWLATSQAPQTPEKPAGKPATPPAARPSRPAAPALPSDLAVKLAVDAAEITYNKGTVRKVVADLTLENGQLAVRRLEALLPGDAQLAGSMALGGDGKTYSGDITLSGPKLRQTLDWLKVDTAQVPAGKLGAFSFKGKLQSAGNGLSVSDAMVQVDGMSARGSLAVALGSPLRVTADLQADTIDVDAYMPRKPAAADKSQPQGKAGKPPARPTPAAIEARIKARVGRIIYNGERIENVDADVTYSGGKLTFGDSKIGSVAGAAVSIKGSIANLQTTPRADLVLSVQASDADRLLKLAGVDSPVKGPIGKVSMQGGVAGTPSDLTFRDFRIAALGADLKMTGKLAPAAGNPRYDLSAFSFQTDDLDKFLSALGQPRAGDAVGAVTASGAVKGDSKNVAFKGSFSAKGVQGNGTVNAALGGQLPRIVANLKTSELNIDRLTQGGDDSSGPEAKGGGGDSGGRQSKKPINLAFMKGIDAELDLAAQSIIKSPWRLDNASLRATLKGGVLTITRLAGGLYGGTVEITGTISALNNTFDARLAASNLNLGTAGRALGDTKRVDGTLTANLSLNGNLASTADLVASLNGDGKVGGNVRFNASIEEQLGGKLAGSALKELGKRLDKITGNKGASEELGDLRAALKVVNERFANRTGPLSGTVIIRKGKLHTDDLRVEGRRAWAITEADINLVAMTMTTTTNVFVEEKPEAPYVIVRQKGPVDNPTRSVDRGPGAAGLGRQQQPQDQQQPQEQQPQEQQPKQQKPNDPLRKLKKLLQ